MGKSHPPHPLKANSAISIVNQDGRGVILGLTLSLQRDASVS